MMQVKEFDALYKNAKFQNRLNYLCNSFFYSNREAFDALAFDEEDLKQECLINIWDSIPNQKISYYIEIAQNKLLDLIDKGNRRDEIIQFEPLDDNLAYSIYEDEKY